MVYSKIINESKHNHGASFNIKGKAKVLRRTMTKPEKLLWNKIRRRQVKNKYFRRQHPYGIYILDFFCFEANLVIEIDGGIHLSKQEYDNERTDYLNSSGLRVLRFKNEEILNNIESVIENISKYL